MSNFGTTSDIKNIPFTQAPLYLRGYTFLPMPDDYYSPIPTDYNLLTINNAHGKRCSFNLDKLSKLEQPALFQVFLSYIAEFGNEFISANPENLSKIIRDVIEVKE